MWRNIMAKLKGIKCTNCKCNVAIEKNRIDSAPRKSKKREKFIKCKECNNVMIGYFSADDELLQVTPTPEDDKPSTVKMIEEAKELFKKADSTIKNIRSSIDDEPEDKDDDELLCFHCDESKDDCTCEDPCTDCPSDPEDCEDCCHDSDDEDNKLDPDEPCEDCGKDIEECKCFDKEQDPLEGCIVCGGNLSDCKGDHTEEEEDKAFDLGVEEKYDAKEAFKESVQQMNDIRDSKKEEKTWSEFKNDIKFDEVISSINNHICKANDNIATEEELIRGLRILLKALGRK
jgi:hypothetical protein